MAIAKGWNATLGRVAGKISPIQADYLIDSNLGFVGDAIIGATTDPKSPAELAKEMQENGFCITAKPGRGFGIEITDAQTYVSGSKPQQGEQTGHTPKNVISDDGRSSMSESLRSWS